MSGNEDAESGGSNVSGCNVMKQTRATADNAVAANHYIICEHVKVR